MPRGMKYPQELRDRAVRMVAEIGEPGAIRRVADKLGVHDDTVRYWVKRAPAELGGKSGLGPDQLEERKSLRRENAQLRRANEILKSASVFSAKELDPDRTK